MTAFRGQQIYYYAIVAKLMLFSFHVNIYLDQLKALDLKETNCYIFNVPQCDRSTNIIKM